jgi:serine/threonine protein phosphatase PrpC
MNKQLNANGTLDVGYALAQGSRHNQEDSLGFRYYADGALLAVLADGMGGHAGGEVASELAVKVFGEVFPQVSGTIPERLTQALRSTNQQLCRRAETSRDLQTMGSTLVAVYAQAESIHWLSVGDSLLYRMSASQLQKLNASHTLGERFRQLLEQGQVSQKEYDTLEKPHALTSALGLEKLHEIDLNTCALQAGDSVLIASDGLLTLDDSSLANVLKASAGWSAQTVADKLLQAVLARGNASQDNLGLIVIKKTMQPAVTRKRDWSKLPSVLGSVLVVAAMGGMGYSWYETYRQAQLAQAESARLLVEQQKAADEAARAKQQAEEAFQVAEVEKEKAAQDKKKLEKERDAANRRAEKEQAETKKANEAAARAKANAEKSAQQAEEAKRQARERPVQPLPESPPPKAQPAPPVAPPAPVPPKASRMPPVPDKPESPSETVPSKK